MATVKLLALTVASIVKKQTVIYVEYYLDKGLFTVDYRGSIIHTP